MNFAIDPITLDLVDSGDWFAEDATAAPMVLCQELHEFNAWPGDPQAGSLIHQLMREGNDGPAGQDAVTREVRRALGILEEAGLIDSVDVVTTRDEAGRIRVDIAYHDRATHRVIVHEVQG